MKRIHQRLPRCRPPSLISLPISTTTLRPSPFVLASRLCSSHATETQELLPNTSFLHGLYLGRMDSRNEVLPYRGRYAHADEVAFLEALTTTLQTSAAGEREQYLRDMMHKLDVSKEKGGYGLSMCAQAHFYERLAEHGLQSFALQAHFCALGASLLKLFGNEAQISEYLPKVADGTCRIQVAMMEPHSLYEFGNCATTAALSSSNASASVYLLNGTKLVVGMGSEVLSQGQTPATAPTHYIVFAKMETQGFDSDTTSDGPTTTIQERLTALLVDAKASGVSTNPSNGTISFHNVAIGAEQIVGVAGAGLRTFLFVRYTSCVIFSAILCGYIRRILPYVSSKGIHAASLYACESTLYLVAGNIDREVPDYIREAISVKLLTTNLLAECQRSLNIDEVPSSFSILKPLASYQALHDYGENHILAMYVACLGCEDFALQLSAASTIEVMQQRTLKTLGLSERLFPSSFRATVPEAFQPHIQSLEKDLLAFSEVIEKAVVKEGVKILRRQCFLADIAGASATLLARAACLSRFSKLHQNVAIDKVYRDVQSADALCALAYCEVAAERFRSFLEHTKSFALEENLATKITQDVVLAFSYAQARAKTHSS